MSAPLESFADLVSSAARQPEPHRLLFVFIRIDRPEGAPLPADGGTLSPIMYTDLLPAPELDFAFVGAPSRPTQVRGVEMPA